MGLLVKIAFRNIFRHKRRSLLTGLMMAGGCLLFAVFIGMVDGSYGLLINMFTLDHTGHIQIHRKGYLNKPSIYKIMRNPSSIGNRIHDLPYIKSWTPRVYTPALAFAGTKTSGVQLMGIDPVREAKTTRLREKIKTGRFLSNKPGDEIIISDRLSRILKAGPGSRIALIAQGVDGSIANDLFTVIGITDSRQSSYGGTTCYVHIDSARNFLSMTGGAHEIAIVLTDYSKTLKTVQLIKHKLNDGSLEIEPWQVVEAQFYRAMQADIRGNWITIIVFTIIIAIGVLNTVLMMVLERTREFGVMKALGTRPSQIFTLILLETASLSLFSIIAGTLAGITANWILSVHGIHLSNPVDWGGFPFDTITSKISLRSVFIPVVVIAASAVAVSIPPAIRASRIRPVKALRSV
ncbi:ABC transporter permease YtrF precursor [bacterium BMS3Abin07]|nr:ABC transporter permease YtrF precursor [bacterium BMS3Abin07]GBE32701.1 ABC transporter permease YtrF precursor [bacterium BMS3Bbin05]HDL19640.1 ABC transporter permease [Nitrospirota bacterium]HDO22073.1 ABC transporter permease [Nitrospirota bacterium]HDZ88931.1 ABC transporter permease [Nitrospirota bacterium]